MHRVREENYGTFDSPRSRFTARRRTWAAFWELVRVFSPILLDRLQLHRSSLADFPAFRTFAKLSRSHFPTWNSKQMTLNIFNFDRYTNPIHLIRLFLLASSFFSGTRLDILEVKRKEKTSNFHFLFLLTAGENLFSVFSALADVASQKSCGSNPSEKRENRIVRDGERTFPVLQKQTHREVYQL